LLVGYFQSPKYFNNYKDTINKILKINTKQYLVKQKVKELNIFDETIQTISIHFRIGDYLNYTNIYPILNEIYYINALNFILTNNKLFGKDINILYFCEDTDLQYVEQIVSNLELQFPFKFVRVNSSLTDWEQMLLMSLCNHNIIANSTFSWWAAYLNSNFDKIVCYPKEWFKPETNKDTTDMFLDDWIPIPIN